MHDDAAALRNNSKQKVRVRAILLYGITRILGTIKLNGQLLYVRTCSYKKASIMMLQLIDFLIHRDWNFSYIYITLHLNQSLHAKFEYSTTQFVQAPCFSIQMELSAEPEFVFHFQERNRLPLMFRHLKIDFFVGLSSDGVLYHV